MVSDLAAFTILFIQVLSSLLSWVVLIWVLMSWFSSAASPLGQRLSGVITPLLAPFRWARLGMIDLSPLVLLLVLNFGTQIATHYLRNWFL